MSISESDNLTYSQLPFWRKFLVDIGITYLGWVLPGGCALVVTYEAKEKTWSIQVLEADAARKSEERDA